MQRELADHLYYFGYAKVEEDNPTGFFEFSDHTPERLALNYKFRADSKACLDEITSEGYSCSNVYINNTGENNDMLSPHDFTIVQQPAIKYAERMFEQASAKNTTS